MDYDWSGIEGIPTEQKIVAGGKLQTCDYTGCDNTFIAQPGWGKYCPDHSQLKHSARHNRRLDKSFRVYDGEETISADHVYGLTGLGNAQEVWGHTPAWWEWLDWAYSHYSPVTINVVFHGKYDWAQIFKSLGQHRAWKLLLAKRSHSNGNPTAFPVDTEAWETPTGQRWLIDLSMRERFLRFKPKNCDCTKSECGCEVYRSLPWMYVNDVGDYFAGSLTDVLDADETLGTPEEREIVYRGKDTRGSDVPHEELALYNRTESKLVAKAMERIRTALHSIGITPGEKEWYGIGKAGQLWMDRYSTLTPRKKSQLPRELLEVSKVSFFGPHFEDLAHGYIAGEAHEYDLNAAFCAILAKMPCMEHGWTHGKGKPGPALPGHIRQLKVHIKGVERAPLGPALFRDEDGLISGPYETVGWHWDFELEARRALGLVSSIRVLEWWDKAPCDCPPPCERISELYKLRWDYDKGTIEHNVFKKLPDTVYGKLAESGDFSKYANPVCASYVTAKCREMVLNAVRTHQDRAAGLLKIASDGFIMRAAHKHPKSLPISTELGEWKHKPHHNLYFFEPGLWWSDETTKISGLRMDSFTYLRMQAEAKFRSWNPLYPDLLHPDRDFPRIDVPIPFRVTTLREAVNFYGPLPEAEPFRTQALRCPECAGTDGTRITYKEYQQSFDSVRPFGSTCPMCGRAAYLEMDHCRRHGLCRGYICHSCNTNLGEKERMASWHLAGRVETDITQERKFWPGRKRDMTGTRMIYSERNQAFMTLPLKGGKVESAPYSRDMGVLDDDIEGRAGWNPDGSNMSDVRRGLGLKD